MPRIKNKKESVDPDRIPLSQNQAVRLAGLTNVASKDLAGKTVLEVVEKYKWKIEPELLLFRKVCGQVVKRDPSTNALHPVPYATVYVEDTDCSLLGYFPTESPWGWYFPLSCKREEIASTVTDACGRFCVYIPRFEIDWILRWRKKRVCFPIIFERPRLRDIIEEFHKEPPRIKWPFPDPDPGPLLRNGGMSLEYVRQILGNDAVSEVALLQQSAQLGQEGQKVERLLDSVAYSKPLPPPLPDDVRALCNEGKRKVLAERLSQSTETVKLMNHRHYIGPFRRCYDIYMPEWQVISDVPDITFKVTQDVDGDGDEETIYSEGFFDVRWNAQSIPDVQLEASQIALTSVDCHPPESLPCEEPEIVLAGKMPLHNEPGPVPPYIDTNGYAKRANRPHPSGHYNELIPTNVANASSPLGGYFPLYGCNQHEGAKYYRLRYTHTPENSATPLAKQTFGGHTWNLYRWVGYLEKLYVSPDSNGWYKILDLADGWMPAYLLLNWPSHQYSDGLYEVEMELGNASKSVVQTTGAVKMRIDNSKPLPKFNGLRWRISGSTAWHSVGLICPVIPRPVGQDIEIEVSYEASADHLRSMILTGNGCGAGNNLELVSGINSARWWHRNAADNYEAKKAIFLLKADKLPGAYGFHLSSHSRAFNPISSAGLSADWYLDLNHIWRDGNLRVSIVDS